MPEVRPTLLFVDDEPDVLEILTRTFERRFAVRTASSGAQALAILSAQPIDLLITDQKMPEMTGIELVLAARAAGIDVTAILLTGYTNPENLIAAINQGQVYRYITKPWDVNDLLITVRNALEYTQLRRDKERLLTQLKKRVEALSVLYEVSRHGASDALTYDAIVDRVLTAVERVLPYDCGAALVAISEARSASLRLRCSAVVGDKALLWVKETVLGAHRRASGQLLPEDRVITRVSGNTTAEALAPTAYPSQLTVSLVAGGRPVGTLSLFSSSKGAYSSEDGELLDVLANQTTDAIQALRLQEDEARRRIERMVESMADGVLLTDEKNEIVVLNPAARQMLRLGDDPRQLTALKVQQTLGFAPFELVRNWEYGGPQVLREELKVFERTIHLTVTPVADARGTLRGVVLVLRDITDQKVLEGRKDDFVSMVSHELRTPLTSISGALDLVLGHLAGEINDKQRRYLEMAKESTERLNATVDDLLDLSKFAQGRLKMSLELTHLDEGVSRAAERYAAAAMERRQRLSASTGPAAVRVLADPARIDQVLNNLLTNAVKFAPEGGEIRLELKHSPGAPGFVSLSVWNSGAAIAEQDLERIFDRFEQAHSATHPAARGTGLGLSICRNIVEAHGGRIWAEPCAGGARFVVVLPIEPVLEEGAEGGGSAPRTGAPQGSVLIVEDEPEIAYVLKATLLGRHPKVYLAGNADEALSLARRFRPDLITLDLRLPDLDGLRLAEIFRHDPDTHHAQLLVISGLDERERAFRQGASAFLRKPVQREKLLATVEALLRGRSGRHHGRVLVVDDDEKISAICGEVLVNLGFEVRAAHSIAEARVAMREARPDVLLLDVGLPDGDGFGFFEELKAERASSHLSVIFISARGETSAKIRALKLGGEDYLTKPFDALELGARVEAVFRRKDAELGASPTTQLPGSAAIEREVQRRLSSRQPFAFCYLDLDNLKAYNDYYGFAKADGVIRQTGDLLRDVVAREGRPGDFLGHVAGDDFVFIADLATVDPICQRAIDSFDRIIPLYYDGPDRERGHIEAEDRFGERRKFPIMSVSIVAVISDGVTTDHAQLARLAADMKKKAKAIQGSVYLRSDRERVARSTAG